jgi:hypothetical protein
MDSPTPVASQEYSLGGGLDYFCPGGALQYVVIHAVATGSAEVYDIFNYCFIATHEELTKKEAKYRSTTNDARVNYFVVPPQAPCFYQIWDLQSNTCIKHIKGLQDHGCNIAAVEGPLGRPILLSVR